MFKLPLIALGLLAGCTSIDMATTAMLSRMNPLQSDPEGYQIIAYLPEGLKLAEGSARMWIKAEYGDQRAEGSYTLYQTGQADGGEALGLKPEDLPDIRALQAKIMALEKEDPIASKGSLSVSVYPCTTGAGPDPEDTMRISIRATKDGPILPLMHPVPVRRIEAALQKETGFQLQPCS